MNNNIPLKEVKNRLREYGLEYETISLQDGFSILCTKRGGRILGPFEDENAESIFWINGAFASSERFGDFLNHEEWNLGGDRFWIAPEHPYFIQDRNHFYDSYTVQKEIDPGNYSLKKDGETVTLEQDVMLKVFQSRIREKKFHVKKVIHKIANPLRALSGFKEQYANVKFCGFQQSIEMCDKSEDSELYLEAWLLTQINPKGKLIVPFTGKMEFDDYYEPIEKSKYNIHDNYMEVDVTGNVRYKLGFKSAVTTGRAGYIGKFTDGRSYLFIRSYYNDPSSVYCCDPFDRPGLNGCSLFLYNDSGGLGGFAEFESTGVTFSRDTGKKRSADSVNYYIYVGEESQLNNIAHLLLGANMES